jgi:hypothetical protein
MSRLTYEAVLSRRTIPCYPASAILSWLSCQGWSVLIVLTRWSYPGCPGSHCFPVPVILSQPFSRCSSQHVLSVLVECDLSRHFCFRCPVLDVRSMPPVPSVLSRLSCLDRPTRAVLPSCPVLTIMFWLFCPLFPVLP